MLVHLCNERLGMAALGIKSAFAHDHIKVGTAAFGRRKQETSVHLCNERLDMAALGMTTSRWVLFKSPSLQRS